MTSGYVLEDCKKNRLVARLDVKDDYLVKGIQLEGVRKIGNPNQFAVDYYQQGIDEIIYVDAVASLYDRNNLSEVVQETCRNVFVPVTVGGGIRSLDDVKKVLDAGADKVAINTAAIKDKRLISSVAERYGSQCMVLSVQAKRKQPDEQVWEAYYDNGRQRSGLDVIEWVKESVSLGAGEILLTSVDREGLQNGMDIDLIKQVVESVNVPVICSGGVGSANDVIRACEVGASAIAIASFLHYRKGTIKDIKEKMEMAGIGVRNGYCS